MTAALEHVNVTVSDPKATAAILIKLFDWKIRWEGPGMTTGYTVHVGTDTGYVALFSFGNPKDATGDHFHLKGALNHIGIAVDDLDAVEAKVKALGFETHSHADYEPGKRFYFNDSDGVEFEVVSYV
jgi:predicted enzyme related to lactoylglutathione lyase